MASDSAKKHSNLDKQDITQGLNALYTPSIFAKEPAKCVDIIAVPGLGSDMTHTWMEKGSHWLKDDNMLQKVIPNARISVFGYRSQWFGPDAVQTNIRAIATDLLHHIQLDRDGKNSKRPIIFVGHSLGGLVVAKAIVEANARKNEYSEIIKCVTSCVFLGTPFRGSEAQSYAKILSIAGDAIGMARYTDILRSLKAGSTELSDLSDAFLRVAVDMSIHLTCYYEMLNTMAKPEWDLGGLFRTGVTIASQKSSTFEGHDNHPWDRTHTQMNKFGGPKDPKFKDLSSTLKLMVEKSAKTMKLRSAALDIFEDAKTRAILDALEGVNPKKDLEAIRRTQGTSLSWIPDDGHYKQWKDNPSHQNFWISGRAGMGKAKAAISIVDDLSRLSNTYSGDNDSPALAFYFCDERNMEKSKALNVLKTLAWQLLNTKRFLAPHFFIEASKSKTNSQKSNLEFTSLTELWKCFQTALVDPELGTTYFVIAGLDQIDSQSRKEFLDLFTSWEPPVMQDEDMVPPVIKWLFLSVSLPDIETALQGVGRIDLDDGSHSSKQQDELRMLVNEKIRKISTKKNYSRSLEYYAKSYISYRAEGKSNYDWVNLVCLELDFDEPEYSAIRRHLESLPSDLVPMYDHLSHRVSAMADENVEHTKEILRSLLVVYLPPTLRELAVIADLPKADRDDEEAIKTHVSRCGAFVDLFLDDNGRKWKVRLSNSSVQEYLRQREVEWLCMPSEKIQQGIVALRCFEYVRATVAQCDEEEAREPAIDTTAEPDSSTEDDEIPDATPLHYPYIQWIKHALEATPDIVDSFGLEDDFWSSDSVERDMWSEIYAKEDDEFDAGFKALHIATYFGYMALADLVLHHADHEEELGMSDSRGNQPLYWACKQGDMNMMRRLCEAGADVNGHDDDGVVVGLTPFHGVAASGNIEMAEYLYAKSAHLDTPNKKHGTPLFIATTQDSIPLAQYFLDRGADPNIIGGYQELPLNAAADSGSVEMAKLLVSRGAEVNPDHTYVFGNALGLAAYCGHLELVNFLLEQGCRVDVPDNVDELPLASAAQQGFNEVVETLLNYDDSPASHDQALLVAVEANEEKVVQTIIDRCPAVQRSDAFAAAASKGYYKILNILTNVGITSDIMDKALYEAADYQHDETVRVLLSMGANPDAEGEGYGNALQAACFDGSEEIVNDLLQAGADVNRIYGENTFGTALQAAAFEGNLTIVQRLLEHGAAINIPACGKYGHPLHAACCTNHPEVVEHLLDSGAEVNAVGGEWSYALSAATGNGYQACADILIARNANVKVRGGKDNSTPLIDAAMELPLSTIKAIYDRGGSVFDVDNDGDSAFTSAAASGDLETLEFLLEKGSDIHLIGKWGGALYRATDNGSIDCVTFLLDHDINVNQKGGELHTSLMAAACGGQVEIVKLLLDRGANIHTKGGLYHTALQAAANGCNTEIVQLLLDKGAKATDLGGRHGSPLHAAIRWNCEVEMVTMLVDHGADVNAISPETGSVLTLAARRADTEKVTYLLEQGADVNVRGGKYETTLQCAAYVAGVEEFQMYLDHSADPTIEGGYYGSALGAAAARGHEEIVQLLLDHEKQPSAHVLTEALYYASHFRKPEIVQKLLDKGADVLATKSEHDCALAQQFCIITRYESVLAALEATLSEEEKAQNEYENDMDEHEKKMKAEADENGDNEDEDEASDDGDSDDGSDDSDDSDSDDLEASDDEDHAVDIEVYEGVKKLLTDAINALKPPSPIREEPVKAESHETEPVKPDPVESELLQPAPLQPEPLRPQPLQPKAVKPETVKQEKPKNDYQPYQAPEEPYTVELGTREIEMYKQASPQPRPELFDRSLLEIDSPVVQRKPPQLPTQSSRDVSSRQEASKQQGTPQVSNTPRQTNPTTSPLQQITPSGRYNKAAPLPLSVLVPSTSSPPPLLREFPPSQSQQPESRPQESSRQSLPSQMRNDNNLPIVAPYPSRDQTPRQSSVTRRPVGATVTPPSGHNPPTRRQVGAPPSSNPGPPVPTQYPSGSETTAMPGMPAQNAAPQYRAYNSASSGPQAFQLSRSEAQPAVRTSSVPNYGEYNAYGQPAQVSAVSNAAAPDYGAAAYPRRSTNPGPLQAVQPSNRVSMQPQDYRGPNGTNPGYPQPTRPDIRPSQDYRGTYPSPSQPAQSNSQMSGPSQEYRSRASTNNSGPPAAMLGGRGTMPMPDYNGPAYGGNQQYDNGRIQQGQPQAQPQQQRPRPPPQNNDAFGNVAGELKNTWNRFRG